MTFTNDPSELILPAEILLEIIQYLPLQELPNVMLISQAFYNTLHEQSVLDTLEANFNNDDDDLFLSFKEENHIKIKGLEEKLKQKEIISHVLNCVAGGIILSTILIDIVGVFSITDLITANICLKTINEHNMNITNTTNPCESVFCSTATSFFTKNMKKCFEITIPIDIVFTIISTISTVATLTSLSCYLYFRKQTRQLNNTIQTVYTEPDKLKQFWLKLIAKADVLKDDPQIFNHDNYEEIKEEEEEEEIDDQHEEPPRSFSIWKPSTWCGR